MPDWAALQSARRDLDEGARAWRSWWVLSGNDIRQRYRRSALGQFWMTISTGATILGMGLVFSLILKQPIEHYLPFLAVGMVFWTFLSSTIIDLTTAFLSSDTYLRSYPGPRSICIFRTMARNIVILMHNLVILPIVWSIFGWPLNAWSLLFIPGLAICLVSVFLLAMVIAPLSARFRDLPQIIQNVLQLLFFLTPVMYMPSQVHGELSVLTNYNPLATLLELMRAPLFGTAPPAQHYLMALLYVLLGFAIAFPFYARFRARIVYWL
jgi:ABC-type polysaccharide/polyol phosphate export permease